MFLVMYLSFSFILVRDLNLQVKALISSLNHIYLYLDKSRYAQTWNNLNELRSGTWPPVMGPSPK